MILYHISHTDLDGYGCQLLTKEYFRKGFFLNANYGTEVRVSITKVLEEIKKAKKEEDKFLLISDLNLTNGESKDLDKRVNALNEEGFNIKLQLLDHHATGLQSSKDFSWYFLDVNRCATKIVFDYMKKEFDAFKTPEDSWIEPLVNCINAIDIWLDDEVENFEFGKVLLSMISKVREINSILFADKNRAFRIHLLKEAATYIGSKNDNINLDNNLHRLKKEYLMLDDKEDTLDNLSAKYLVHTLEDVKEDLTIIYKGQKGLLTYCLGSISIPANAFLKANSDYDFFIDVGRKGNASLRADGKLDVSLLASKLGRGGGHVNASGTKLSEYKELPDFKQVKNFIQQRLDKL